MDDYDEATKGIEHLFEHALTDCGDPDCEIHNPWVQEDKNERLYAFCYFVAGAQWAQSFMTTQIDEMHERAQDEMKSMLMSPDRMEELY